jgi:hypothetical protein
MRGKEQTRRRRTGALPDKAFDAKRQLWTSHRPFRQPSTHQRLSSSGLTARKQPIAPENVMYITLWHDGCSASARRHSSNCPPEGGAAEPAAKTLPHPQSLVESKETP